jgi:hypothetical protein
MSLNTSPRAGSPEDLAALRATLAETAEKAVKAAAPEFLRQPGPIRQAQDGPLAQEKIPSFLRPDRSEALLELALQRHRAGLTLDDQAKAEAEATLGLAPAEAPAPSPAHTAAQAVVTAAAAQPAAPAADLPPEVCAVVAQANNPAPPAQPVEAPDPRSRQGYNTPLAKRLRLMKVGAVAAVLAVVMVGAWFNSPPRPTPAQPVVAQAPAPALTPAAPAISAGLVGQAQAAVTPDAPAPAVAEATTEAEVAKLERAKGMVSEHIIIPRPAPAAAAPTPPPRPERLAAVQPQRPAPAPKPMVVALDSYGCPVRGPDRVSCLDRVDRTGQVANAIQRATTIPARFAGMGCVHTRPGVALAAGMVACR